MTVQYATVDILCAIHVVMLSLNRSEGIRLSLQRGQSDGVLHSHSDRMVQSRERGSRTHVTSLFVYCSLIH